MDHASVRLLKERFHLEDGEAEHILGSFVEAVERSLEEYGICHVTGIGSFVRAPGDSRISFDPSDELTRAVNVRFADLPVYEIDTEEASDRSVAASMTEGASEQPLAAPTTEGAKITPGTDESTISEREPLDSPAESLSQEAKAAPEEVEEPATAASDELEKPAAATPDGADVPIDSEADSETDQESGQSMLSPAESRSPRRRREKRSGGIRAVWFALPVIIILAVAAVWLLQRPATPGPEPDSMASRTSPATEAPDNELDAAGVGDDPDPSTDSATDEGAGAGTDPAADENAAGQLQVDQTVQATDAARASGETPTDASAEEVEPEYALDRTVDGYTMIVGSSPDPDAAGEQISRFTELDLPFGVLDYSEDGSPMYRLAVGLFDSAQQADSARQAMEETLPSGTWVWRIR